MRVVSNTLPNLVRLSVYVYRSAHARLDEFADVDYLKAHGAIRVMKSPIVAWGVEPDGSAWPVDVINSPDSTYAAHAILDNETGLIYTRGVVYEAGEDAWVMSHVRQVAGVQEFYKRRSELCQDE